jgi:hypothetical protein
MIIVTMTSGGQYETNADTWDLHEGNLILKYQGKIVATLAAGQWEGVFEVEDAADFETADADEDVDAQRGAFLSGFGDGRP